jgi:hypothetical protein
MSGYRGLVGKGELRRTLEAGLAVELSERKGEQTAEGSCHRSSGEEESDAELALGSLIPGGEVV